MALELFSDTIAAVSTAEARAALGIVRISGRDAIAIVARIVKDSSPLLVARGGSSFYSSILTAPSLNSHLFKEGSERGLIDDVIIHVFRSPRSYTGEDLCEITTHGSPIIAREVLSALIHQGAREAEPGEFSRRAFFHGKIGLEGAELISIKANASSEQELRGAELALHEKFERLRAAYDDILSLIALVDAEIDFGDSDSIAIHDFDVRVANVINALSSLMHASITRRENAGFFTVALTGPPNVGKSSIFNALLNFERSIVSEVPGTTRDYVEAFIEIDGFRVKLIDTAGVRTAEESIEARGIALGADAARHADIALRVTEPSERFPSIPTGVVLLHNKIDLDHWNSELAISAASGAGIPKLHAWLSDELKLRSQEFSQISLSDSERQKVEWSADALKSISLELEPALIAEDLRSVAAELSHLLGMNIGQDSLDHIFSKMCIGK
ncbi:MAG TPA: GTPase [Candidatus Kapabacteria bacterium]